MIKKCRDCGKDFQVLDKFFPNCWICRRNYSVDQKWGNYPSRYDAKEKQDIKEMLGV